MASKEELMKKAYDLAFKYEAERGSCSQCVLSAIHETLGIIEPETIKASDALAGGSSLSTKGTCGALVGGFMAISTIVGREYESFSRGEKKRRVFRYAKMLYGKFYEEYGSPVCENVHKKLFGRTFNLMDKEEYQAFEDAGAHVDKCPVVSGKTASWTVEIIIDNLSKYLPEQK